MTQGSSLPPLKKRDGKYGLIALLFVLGALGLWFFWTPDEPEAPDEIAQPEPEPTPAPREQFAAELEIPDDLVENTGGGGEAEEEQSAKPTGAGWTPPEEWECLGTLQASQIRNVINGQPRKQVQTCYERRLKDNNLLQGSMKVLLTIGANGNVRAVSIEGSLDDPQVYSCVKRVAKTWKFPKPQGGCVRTEVPFQMTPKL
ncbi:MAG TPA: AgmX/PglI C-terminal domain-containing protein [Polyangiales bacterium]|nr:AgmX/PglI C-terminal domain-containing protein [Polyangiales bacterium]